MLLLDEEEAEFKGSFPSRQGVRRSYRATSRHHGSKLLNYPKDPIGGSRFNDVKALIG
jgi:hypothetical protein